jgi:hypothetical protein
MVVIVQELIPDSLHHFKCLFRIAVEGQMG